MAQFGLLDATQTVEYPLPGTPLVQWDPAPVIATSPTGSQRRALERSFTWTFSPGAYFTPAEYHRFNTLRAADGTIYVRTRDEDGLAVVWRAKTDDKAAATEYQGWYFGVVARFYNAVKV
jgi:hypothetical protein